MTKTEKYAELIERLKDEKAHLLVSLTEAQKRYGNIVKITNQLLKLESLIPFHVKPYQK